MARVTTKIIRKPRTASVIKGYEGSLRALVGRAGNLVRNTAIQSINQGSRSGAFYMKGGETGQRSAAGEPPKTDEGILAGSIVIDVDPDGLGASVESRADYSEALEFGTSKMAARPFMQPALEENKPKINRLAKQMVKAK